MCRLNQLNAQKLRRKFIYYQGIKDIHMKYALFLGCNIPARVDQYDASARAVLRQVGVQLKDIREFNCCRYPMRNADQKSFLFSSAVNLALFFTRNCSGCAWASKKRLWGSA